MTTLRSNHRMPWTPEEDKILKKYAGIKPAYVIKEILDNGRTASAVQQRISKLGVDGRQYGEKHWAARISDMQADIIKILFDAGYTQLEIAKTLNINIDITNNVCAGRTRVKSCERTESDRTNRCKHCGKPQAAKTRQNKRQPMAPVRPQSMA